jgi:hypothetical protein
MTFKILLYFVDNEDHREKMISSFRWKMRQTRQSDFLKHVNLSEGHR